MKIYSELLMERTIIIRNHAGFSAIENNASEFYALNQVI
jgi:3-methyladenine DNA glycosylase Tag